MKYTNTLRLVACLSLFFPIGCVSYAEPQEKACYWRRNNQCYTTISIYSLLSNSSKYNGIPVAVTAFLGIDQNDAFLYPTKDAYDNYDSPSSIQLIHDDMGGEDIEAIEARSGQYVVVYGTFHAEYDAGLFFGARSGSIKLDGIPESRGGRVMDKSTKEIQTIIRDLDISP